jgi:hypothetical protein
MPVAVKVTVAPLQTLVELVVMVTVGLMLEFTVTDRLFPDPVPHIFIGEHVTMPEVVPKFTFMLFVPDPVTMVAPEGNAQ